MCSDGCVAEDEQRGVEQADNPEAKAEPIEAKEEKSFDPLDALGFASSEEEERPKEDEELSNAYAEWMAQLDKQQFKDYNLHT